MNPLMIGKFSFPDETLVTFGAWKRPSRIVEIKIMNGQSLRRGQQPFADMAITGILEKMKLGIYFI